MTNQPETVPDHVTLTRDQLAAALAHHADVLAASLRTDRRTGLPEYAPGLQRATELLDLHAEHLTAETERPAVAELLDSMLTFHSGWPGPVSSAGQAPVGPSMSVAEAEARLAPLEDAVRAGRQRGAAAGQAPAADLAALRGRIADGQGEPEELRSLPREVRRLVHAVDRMRADWAEAPESGPERQEMWVAVHAACDAVWNRDSSAAVLPAPTDTTAVLTPAERTMLTYALDQAQEAIWSEDGFTDEDQAAVTSLRRLADETQDTQPATPRPSLREQHRAAWTALSPAEQAARLAALDADDNEQPAPTTPAPTTACRTFISGGDVWCCEDGETDCPCVCHEPAARPDGPADTPTTKEA
ncbi:antitoxin (DNA-binding transcriptional repressor) of toxin-antitoxin stability system [Streptomyces sp. B3I7]|uniref:hypothetical protein n=1 Tax=Streptomyces sp. B3I7 TaxID=3042269 RepID=UPI00277F4015|nr:hypothetical protein [Streptomyces sp. B3I7]MDQ0809884.1 antitoxin (DNA-binding transcriptional repressor) of toxin-antitoxin stability system [Streptomyces sp. B3I7]